MPRRSDSSARIMHDIQLTGAQMNQAINSDVQASMDASVLCWLATVSSDGHPNVSPKEVFVAYEDALLIAHIASPQTMRNLKENTSVCVSFVDVFVQKGYQLKGDAKVFHRGDEGFSDRHAVLFEIAGPDFPFASLIEISVNSVKEIIAPRYKLFPETTERQQVESAMKGYRVRPAIDSDD